jgi:uncharacterized protein DUF6580
MSRPSFASLAALLLMMLAVASRVLPHPWNFTPMIAIALFGGARLARGWVAAAATIACLALGELAVGVFPYAGMAWVYGSMIAIALMGRALQTRAGWAAPLVAALGAGLLFFLVTNFGFWAAGTLYARTLSGLVECYGAALPFYRNQLVGDLLFTGALFGLHAAAVHVRESATSAAAA